MKKHFLFFAFIFFWVGLDAQNPFRIRVLDAETSDNVTKALVYIEEIALPDQETDVNGVVIFQNVPNDRKVKVVVRKKGYISEQTEIVANVAIKVDNYIIIKLKKEPTTPPIIIWGEVTDKNKEEVESATVEINILGKSYKGTTNESGNYQIKIDANELRAASSFQLEVKKTGCDRYKSTETVPQSGHINKDIVLSCSLNRDEAKVTEKDEKKIENKILSKKTVSEIEVRITGFEKSGNRFIVNFECENTSISNQKKNVSIYGNDCHLIDQNGNNFKSIRMKVGSVVEEGYTRIDLIQGNPVQGFIEFEVGDKVISKMALLAMTFQNRFEFYNINVKK